VDWIGWRTSDRRLADAEIDFSVGTVGDAYDNALAERVIGLVKSEVINQICPCKSMREVEWETRKWPYGDASITYWLTGRLVS
jgi:transposase InsO family protein